MAPLPRRLVFAVVTSTVVAAASAVVPVRMVSAAPQVRLVELSAPPARTLRMPFAGQVRLARTIPVPFAVSHLGVRWTGNDDARVEVRTAPAPGAWGEWRRPEVAHDLGDERRHKVLSGLVRGDGARLVQVRAAHGARDVRVVAIDAVNGPRRRVRASPRPAGAEVASPNVVSRAQWGADESMRRGTPEHQRVSRMVVHHTVTPNDDHDPASTVRAIYAYHVRANGWDDIGYNFLVDGYGRVYEGRHSRAYVQGEVPTGESVDGRGVVGAHAEGENAGSVGVAVMGTFTNKAPPQAVLDALQRVLAWKADRHGIDPTGSTTWASGRSLPTIAGHRDVGRTACPGDHLHARLPAIRQAVAAAVAEARAATAPGYWIVRTDGNVVPFGRAAAPAGGASAPLSVGAVAMAATPSGHGYWVLTEEGRVLPFGDAVPVGSPELLGVLEPRGRAVDIEATPSGLGYWIAEEGGPVRAFGDAPDLGGSPAGPVVAMARTVSGRGYWLALADGTVSAHGDAAAMGPAAGRTRAPIVAIAAARGSEGYWLVAADGAVLAFGGARRAGGLPERGVRARVVDAAATRSGRGYYLLGDDGGVFALGDAAFHGAATGPGARGAAGIAVMGG